MLSSRLFQGDALLERIADDVGGERISTNQHSNDPAVRKIQTALLLWDNACLPIFRADGNYGSETANAVVRFKREVLLTPQPINDVGPLTVQRLDQIAHGHELTPFKIKNLRLFADDFATALDWDTHVIGLNVPKIYVEVEGFGFLNETPGSVAVELSSMSPNNTGHQSSVPRRQFDIPAVVFPPDPLVAGNSKFHLAIELSALEPFNAVTALTVATVVRQTEPAFPGDPHSKGPATSDTFFRSGLGSIAGRGFAQQTREEQQAGRPLSRDGDSSLNRPDSLSLILSAGVEILVANCSGQTTKALLRRPANLFYYSGHGLRVGNCLGIAQRPTADSYTCWASAPDLVATWTSLIPTRTFVIAGCSLLAIDFSTAPPSGTGLAWAGLLRFKGGPLDTLLGYRGSAPSDSLGGNDIATEFAQKIRLGQDPSISWMDVNEAHHAWNAVAVDGNGKYTFFEGLAIHTRQTNSIP